MSIYIQRDILFPNMDLTFADFFSGCGGLSLGFMQAGLKCISAMEMDVDASRSFWLNLCVKGWSHLWVDGSRTDIDKIRKRFGDGHTHNSFFEHGIPDNWLSSPHMMPCLNLFMYDINTIEPEQWMDMIGVRAGDIKIFAGGPPCQGFSTANHDRHIGDSRNKLPLRFIYYCKVCKPDMVLMENVPGLLSIGKNKGYKESPFVNWLREAFEDAGYDMNYDVHNAADYGVPQNRKRVIFIATRKTRPLYGFETPKTHGDGLLPRINVMEAIGNLPPVQAGESYTGDPYVINPRKGYVICPRCFSYNQTKRIVCHNCTHDLGDGAIKGAVLKIPKLGFTAIDCNPISRESINEFENIIKTNQP